MKLRRVCVYCGAARGHDPRFATVAQKLGYALAAKNIELVYGGGKVGLMGVLADAVLEKGGRVTGIIPQRLVDKEQAHQGLQDLRIVNDMHERKAAMATLADGFIALPGGFGTLEELFEVLTWSQIGYHTKPIVILDVADYYKPLHEFIEQATVAGFIGETQKAVFRRLFGPEQALEFLENAL
jgi:hypothetical protein